MTRRFTSKTQFLGFAASLLVFLITLAAPVTHAQRAGAAHLSVKPNTVPVPQDATSFSRRKNTGSGAISPGNVSFLPAVTYGTGGLYGISVAAADLNGDGHIDIVTANQQGDGSACSLDGCVGVLLGIGDGTFLPAVDYDSGGQSVRFVTVADVNGDGRPDLVVANPASSACPNGSVDVLLGNGDGTFRTAVGYCSGGSYPNSVAVADVNGDGRPDLVVSNGGSSNLGVLLGNGDGTFQTAVTYNSGWPGPIGVVVADLSGDHKLDLVVAGGGSIPSVVSVLLGNGDGTFQSAVTYSSGGYYAFAVSVTDLNGDGFPDLLVSNERACSSCLNGSVDVLLGNGNGTFQPAVGYSSGGQGLALAVADLDGDGIADLLVADYQDNLVSVLLGNGDATFQPAVTYASGGMGPFSVAIADVNGDGKPDLLVVDFYGNGNDKGLVAVLLNNSVSPNPTSTALITSLNPSVYGQTVTLTATVTSSAGTPTGIVQILNGSTVVGSGALAGGRISIPVSSLSAGSNSITANYEGGGGFASSSASLTQVVSRATSATTLTSSANPAATGQLIIYTATVSSQYGSAATGSVTFTSGSSTLGTSSLSGNVATLTTSFSAPGVYIVKAKYNGDANNTGSTSASLNQIISASLSLFLPAVTYPTVGFSLSSVAVADMNSDGKPDIVVANSSAFGNDGAVEVLLGNGNGSFQPAVAYDSGGGNTVAVAVGDLNGDRNLDLVAANGCINTKQDCGAVGSGVGVLLGNPNGTFRPAVSYPSGGSIIQSVAVGKLFGGVPVIVVSNLCSLASGGCTTQDGNVGVLVGNGDGTFGRVRTFDAGGYQTTGLAFADVNGDGNADVVVASACTRSGGCANGIVHVLLGDGFGNFTSGNTYPAGNLPLSVAVADVNGDGKPDLLVTDYGSGSPQQVSVLLGNGDGTFKAAVAYDSGGSSTSSVAVGDVNGDGKLDLVVSNAASGTVGALLGNGDGTFQAPLTFSSGGSTPYSIALADLNGDGRPDVVVANDDSNTVGVLLNSTGGGPHTTTTALASSLNPSLYGQKVTWTATVTTSGPVLPTGSVIFSWSGYNIGSATLNGSGIAILTRSNLNADAYPLVAVYKGDANNLGSTSLGLNQVVQQTTSSATLTSSPNPSTQGQAVSFTAKISSPTVTPTGPVTFTAGKTVLGTAQLSGGKATFTTSTLPAGSTTITATYLGDSNIAKCSASVTQTVH